MKRTIGVVAILAVLAALLLWRRCGGEASDGARTVQPKPTAAASNSGTARVTPRQDPRTLKRASITGTVRDPDKAPIAGARVCADGWSWDVPGELLRAPTCVDTDAQGAYRIDNLLAATYRVSASAKTFRPGVYERRDNDELRLAAGEAKADIDIVLERGGVEITGTVSDITGGPVAHALVRASSGFWGGTQGPPVTTDDKGRYSMWTKPGSVRVSASADGYADANESGDAPGTIDVLLTPESSLSGTVVDAATNAPVAGARVTVQSNTWGESEYDLSDTQGKFRVRRLTPGRYVAEARTERGYGRTEGSLLVGLGQHDDEVIVRVHPAMRIQGTVVIKGEKPTVCEDAHAWFRDADNERWVSGRTEPDGTITADGVVPGTYTVNIGCDGYTAVKDKQDPIVVKDKDVVGLVWEVEAGSAIKGKVTNKRGEPISDVDVYARSVGGDARADTQWSSSKTKADGSFELDALKPGTYKLDASTNRGVPPADDVKVEVPAGKTVERDIVLDDGGRIEGLVVDDKGTPVEGVRINASAIARTYDWSWDGGKKSDAAGKFAVESLRPGDYRVTASRSWAETLRKPGTSDDDTQGEKVAVRVGETTKVKLVVESQSGTIKGVVVDADGKPVSDAYLSAARESDAAGARASNVAMTRDWDWGDQTPTLTGVDGTFAITKLSPGKYTVRAYRKGGGEAVVEHVAVGTSTRLQIKHTGSIAGVAKRDGGPPPDEITIELTDLKTGFSRHERYYKTAGAFTIHDLPKGHFHLNASTEGGSKKIELDLAEGETKTGVEVVFDSLVTITGRVVEYGTQKPVSGMRVFAGLATGGDRFSFGWGDGDNDNISDAEGRFTVKRVPRGQISVHGMAKDFEDSDHTWFQALRTVTGTSATFDIGHVAVLKKRVKKGDKAGELGINFKELPPETPPDQRIYEVSYIDPKGPAVKSGIEVGDVVTTIDGIDVQGGNAMHGYTLMHAPPGTTLTFGLKRGATVKVTLAEP